MRIQATMPIQNTAAAMLPGIAASDGANPQLYLGPAYQVHLSKAADDSIPAAQTPSASEKAPVDLFLGPAYTVELSGEAKAALENAPTLSSAERLSAERLKEEFKEKFSGADLPGTKSTGENNVEEASKAGETQCAMCAARAYIDGSADSAVSYQSATKISAQYSKYAVASHEREHVFRENAKAIADGGRVTRQSVTIKTDICPECGASYSSGGVTHTETKTPAPDTHDNPVPEKKAS